jgi:hypothetical protein
MTLMPSPLRTIALMISTFSVSITMCDSIAFAREERLYQPARDRPALEQDERLPVEVGRCDLGLLGQRVGRVGDEQQLVLKQGYFDEVAGVHWQRDQAEVRGARPQHGDGTLGAADRDFEVEVGDGCAALPPGATGTRRGTPSSRRPGGWCPGAIRVSR